MRFALIATILLLTACALPQRPAQPDAQQSSSSSAEMRAEETGPATETGTALRVGQRMLASGLLETGDANAPVSMLLFTNHACAYCMEFQRDLMPRLIEDFIRDGQLRVTTVPFVIRKYPASERAALLMLCAAGQGKGIEVNDLLFTHEPDGSAFRTQLATFGLDQAALEECAQSDSAKATVSAHQSMAQSLGVTLVPTYFLNGTMYTGLPEYADLRGQVREAIK